MTIQRLEHVGVVVDDVAAATAFLVELVGEVKRYGGSYAAARSASSSALVSRRRAPAPDNPNLA